jgi:SAM-dependent methyltransferase
VTQPVELEGPLPFSIEDEKFDLIYPAKIRALSPVFWTPVAVAAEAAKWLVTAPRLRVLDIGCGPGKFCLVAALVTEGRFTGVDQRSDLITIARQAASELKLPDVGFIHGNVLDLNFGDFEAFYLFNPFEENMFQGKKIDRAVPLSPELFKKYTSHVSTELGARPIGTRVATYMGYANDIPSCYSCESTHFGDDLKLWIKEREYDPDLESFEVARSYHGSAGWQPSRP